MSSVLGLLQILKRAQVLLDSTLHDLSVDQDIVLEGVFEWDDFKFRLLPGFLNRHKHLLVLSLSVSMLDDHLNLLAVRLDVMLFQVNYGESSGVLQVLSLDQLEDLLPMSLVQVTA
jgi:hypothetical protein